VCDFTHDEDRCRARTDGLPRNIDCLANAAIAMVQCRGRSRFAARASETINAVMAATCG